MGRLHFLAQVLNMRMTLLFSRDYWGLLGITGDYWGLLGITGDYWDLLEVLGNTEDYLGLFGIPGDYCHHLLVYCHYHQLLSSIRTQSFHCPRNPIPGSNLQPCTT